MLCAALQKSLSISLNPDGILSPSGQAPDDPSLRHRARHTHTRVFLSHTADDNVIDISLGKEMREILTRLGMHNVVWKEYETGGHWISEPEGFEDMVEFLSETLGLQSERRNAGQRDGKTRNQEV